MARTTAFGTLNAVVAAVNGWSIAPPPPRGSLEGAGDSIRVRFEALKQEWPDALRDHGIAEYVAHLSKS